MLAWLTTNIPQKIVMERVKKPKLREDELLIQVSYCGVCGSDLHAFKHAKGYEFVQHPRILGHEISGVVVEAGSDKLQNRIGQKVIVESMNYCGTCENCHQGRFSICLNNQVIGLHFDGGMAEFVKVKDKYVKEINELPLEIAVLSEPMAVAVHAVNRLNSDISNKVILVQGAGVIGFFVALQCIEKGAKVYISGLKKDYENRLKKFEKFQLIPHIAEHGLLKEKVDVVFECSGSNLAVQSSFQQLKKGGAAVIVALYEQVSEIFLSSIVRNEWMIIPSYGCDPNDYKESLRILKKYSEQLKEIMSYYPFDNADQAFIDGLHQKVLKPIIKIS